MLISGAQGKVAHTFHNVHLERVVGFCPDVDSGVAKFSATHS
jgi:hypothetical protein